MNPIVEQEKKKGTVLVPLTDKIMVEVSEYKEITYVGIRKWYQEEYKTEWFRSKQGINIPIKEFKKNINAVIEMINKGIS